MSGIPGIVEINSFGGYLKQYEVAVDPDALYSLNITIGDVFEALSRNNQNTGGSYIERVNRAYYIRSEGMISSLDDVRQIVVANRGGIPIHVSDVATVKFGSAKRFGAMTRDGKGECVGDIAMMLKGANANVVTRELESRVAKIQKILPEGVTISPYLNRSELVNRNILTVIRNLIEGSDHRLHRADHLPGQRPGRADRGVGDPAGDALRLHSHASVRGFGQPDESWRH